MKTREVVTIIEEPAFRLSGTSGYLPVSRDMPEITRETYIRELKQVNFADSIAQVCVFGLAGLFVTLCISLVLSVVHFLG